MITKLLTLAAAPLAGLAALAMAAPASAAVFFNNNDAINITASFQAPTPQGVLQFAKADGTFSTIGDYGNLGVFGSPTTTGAFAPFSTNGAVTAGYEILSVNFNDVATYVGLDFLQINNGVDTFKFVITDPIANYSPLLPNNFTAVGVTGIFKSLDDQVLGSGSLTGQFNKGANGSFSGTLTVTETVPEPSALLGIGLMVGAVYTLRRRQLEIA